MTNPHQTKDHELLWTLVLVIVVSALMLFGG